MTRTITEYLVNTSMIEDKGPVIEKVRQITLDDVEKKLLESGDSNKENTEGSFERLMRGFPKNRQ